MLAESFWEVMFDNLHQGIYVLDHVGRYIYCNRAFLQMTGAQKRGCGGIGTEKTADDDQYRYYAPGIPLPADGYGYPHF